MSPVTVAVGSLSRLRGEMVRAAFQASGFDVFVEPVACSVAPTSPSGDEEILRWARDCASQAWDVGRMAEARYSVGLAEGVVTVGGALFAVSWAVVMASESRIGFASGPRVSLIRPLAELVSSGEGLSVASAVESHYRDESSREDYGYSGYLTRGAVTRAMIERDAVVHALGAVTGREVSLSL